MPETGISSFKRFSTHLRQCGYTFVRFSRYGANYISTKKPYALVSVCADHRYLSFIYSRQVFIHSTRHAIADADEDEVKPGVFLPRACARALHLSPGIDGNVLQAFLSSVSHRYLHTGNWVTTCTREI